MRLMHSPLDYVETETITIPYDSCILPFNISKTGYGSSSVASVVSALSESRSRNFLPNSSAEVIRHLKAFVVCGVCVYECRAYLLY